MKYYVAKGVRTVNNEAETKWLELDDGYWSWGTTFGLHLHLFETETEAIKAAKIACGPWYHEPAKDSIVAVPVEYTPPVKATLKRLDG